MSNPPQGTCSPPRPPPIQYSAPLGTRLAREKMAAGGAAAFDLPSDPKSIGPWILGECIGKGSSGRVKIARHRLTGQLAAVKILPTEPKVDPRSSLETRQLKSERQRFGIQREIAMMKLMNHPHIMRIYDVYEGKKELFLVLEYVEGGELFDLLVNRGRLPPHEALVYFKQIIYGLNYAHAFSIVHRDLKPENILIASLSPPLIKIADWGMATFAPPSLTLETSCGSPHYASPEIVNGDAYEGTATDIWSCGVILFALLAGRLPFDDKNTKALLAKVKTGKYDMPNWIDPLAKDLLKRMLVVDPKKRIAIPDILSHPWLSFSYGKSDFGYATIIPHLPPPPHELEQPISSAEDIDPELLESLRVIWGLRVDRRDESIIQDLCSPPGYGLHTKAIYYLLRRYRERKRLIDGTAGYLEIFSREAGRPITVYRPRRRTRSTHQRSHSATTSSGPTPAVVTVQNQIVSDRNFNYRLTPPASPRPLQSARFEAGRTQPRQEFTDSHMYKTSPSFCLSGTGGQNSSFRPAKQGNAWLNLEHMPDWQAGGKVLCTDHKNNLYDTPNVYISQNLTGTNCNETAPRNAYPLSSGGQMDTRNEAAMKRRAARSCDKENQSMSDEGWCYIGSEQKHSAGFGVNDARDVGKEIGNFPRNMRLASPSSRFKKVRARKSRPPPLKIPPRDTDTNNLGLVDDMSPMQGTPGSGGSNSPVLSPIVGEFRGWLSNLFNRKSSAQAILYSVHDMPQTRLEVGRLVESLGITIEGPGALTTNGDNGDTLKCRLEEVPADVTSTINLKPIRFRIEFCTAQTYSSRLARDNGYFPDQSTTAPSPPVIPKGRGSSLTGRSTNCYTPLSSPGFYLPSGYNCAIIMIHEKGSVSTFRAVWKWLREVYCGGTSPDPSCSPPAIPFADNHSRLVSN